MSTLPPDIKNRSFRVNFEGIYFGYLFIHLSSVLSSHYTILLPSLSSHTGLLSDFYAILSHLDFISVQPPRLSSPAPPPSLSTSHLVHFPFSGPLSQLTLPTIHFASNHLLKYPYPPPTTPKAPSHGYSTAKKQKNCTATFPAASS